ncbi:peptide-methionine (S)-S-oxide reductase MsrA [Roseicella frigidaeris]|uniref:Peptide methionine sulfoxide reductase MsrA n=1 Tax=Roseicella frigidaeris TaxID=2230885 RepID=A0A327M7L7_9PROT|nr:peptide-methionine (S)-S-oxide reductase MsrA [Roseicella frigidaeris]RAI58477.1 peptide-methionine (S)-S-oxide reductase [Roseicella frigidaeris]
MSGTESGHAEATTEVATLGGGCFWCLDAVFRDLRGVTGVHSGYAGGHVENPTYEQVCGKRTGHAEVVQVSFDPRQLSYEDLLRVFFTIHDPTTKDRQGNDVGPQYRSVILYHSPEQKAAAERVMAEVTAQDLWGAPLVTELVPFDRYWPGEPEHQDYFARTPWSGYCQVVIAPKVAKFRKLYADRLKRPAA